MDRVSGPIDRLNIKSRDVDIGKEGLILCADVFRAEFFIGKSQRFKKITTAVRNLNTIFDVRKLFITVKSEPLINNLTAQNKRIAHVEFF
jgi:hypothetical protein